MSNVCANQAQLSGYVLKAGGGGAGGGGAYFAQ
jgi:hypothetical protein